MAICLLRPLFHDGKDKFTGGLARLRQWVPKIPAIADFINGDGRVAARHPGEMKTLTDAIAELNVKRPDLHHTINIGFPRRLKNCPLDFAEHQCYRRQKQANRELEKAARQRTLKVPLEDVHGDWATTVAPQHIKEIAEHYGVFDDLFQGAHFMPNVLLDISYNYNDVFTPVFRGNHIKPSEAGTAPEVCFAADADSLWTLVLTNPDGHFQDNSSEYLHWLIGNIPGNHVEKGEIVCDYMQPFPPKGSGFHRFVFVLYKQEGQLNYSSLKRNKPCLRLSDRTFKTFNFYKDRQDVLTPAGLAFFQCDWDESLKDFFHNTLNMRQPMFEYDFPPPYIRPQEKKPEGKPFNLYLEKYRDSKDIGKEILLKRLKNMHPFEVEPPIPTYPHLHQIPRHYPSWLKTELKKERFKIGKYRDLSVKLFKPQHPKRVDVGMFKVEHTVTNENSFDKRKLKL